MGYLCEGRGDGKEQGMFFGRKPSRKVIETDYVPNDQRDYSEQTAEEIKRDTERGVNEILGRFKSP